MLTSKEYRELDEKALRSRLDYDLLDDRLDMDDLARKASVTLVPYSSLPDKAQVFIEEKREKLNDGFFIKRNTDAFPMIFFNDRVEPQTRIRFTLAHEFKHFVFDDRNGDRDEEAANHFARQMLIPTCLVMMYLRRGYEAWDLSFRFDVSLQVAENACAHAQNRMARRGDSLEDYETEFMQAYYRKQYSVDFKSFNAKEETSCETKDKFMQNQK